MSGNQYPTLNLDLTDFLALGRQGKFIIYRSEDDITFTPIAETTNRVYTDFTAILGKTYYYKYKYIIGARDGAETTSIRFDTIPEPKVTPTPTCALYRYAHTHTITHTGLSDVNGNYDFVPAEGIAKNADSDVQLIYNTASGMWVIASKTTILTITELSPGNENHQFAGMYISSSDWKDSRTFDRIPDSSTNTTPAPTKIIATRQRGDTTYIASARDSQNQPVSLSWSASDSKKPYIGLATEKTTVDYQTDILQVQPTHIRDLSVRDLLILIDTNSVYYYKKDSTGEFIPRNGWIPGAFWSRSQSIFNKYFKEAVFDISCYQLTPTSTPPTPTPTPTPTNPFVVIYYMMTESSDPLTTETGIYFVVE